MNKPAKIIIAVQTAIILLFAALSYNYKCEAKIQADTALMHLEKSRINQQDAEKLAERAQENQEKANTAAVAAMEAMDKLKKCKDGE
ncbi:MAG: hypothetical protein RIG77_09030 [Cyclobacteriaceae bacterium]